MKKILGAALVGTMALAVLAVTAMPALAASPSATDLTSTAQMIRPGPDLTVFGIDLSGSSLTSVSTVHVDFANVGADTSFDMGDLEASPDGVALWRDDSNATPQTQDVLDPGDTKLSTSFTVNGMRANLNILPAWNLPAASASEGSYTLLLTVRVSASVSDGDDFTVTLPSDAFQSNIPIIGFAAVTSHTITADPTSPTVQWFAPAIGQADNIYWQLSEPVTGVGPSTVAFRLHGTGTDVPATASFDTATNRVVLDPATLLTAGQYYDAILLPNGPGGIVDRAGNELAPDSRSFRAATDISELAYGASYQWWTHGDPSTFGGSYTVNNVAGSAASYTFTGTSVTWYTVTDPYQGKASVFIDNHAKGQVNNYSATAKYKVARTYTGLPAGTHTILVRADGVKGSTYGRDTRVIVDAFKVGATLAATPVAVYNWGAVNTSSAYGGTYRASRLGGTWMTFLFRGTSIDWRTVLGRNMGRANVYVDGVFKGTINNYSAVTTFKYSRTFGALTDALHTLKIVVSTKDSRASDSLIAIDGFGVEGL